MHNESANKETSVISRSFIAFFGKKAVILMSFLAAVIVFTEIFSIQVAAAGTSPDYGESSSWAYYAMSEDTLAGKDISSSLDKQADCFLVCPAVYMGDAEHLNMSLQDEKSKYSFVGALNMEAGIYMDTCRMFAPFYRMMSLSCYDVDLEAQRQGAVLGSTTHAGYINGNANLAYSDVKAAFEYYLDNENNGRPIVLAGFSQGSEMLLRLMEDYENDPRLYDNLVAAYAIGWRVTKDDLDNYPCLKMAQNETDTGVIVSFNSEDESVTDSLMVPKGTYTYGINPLNWTTDNTVAGKELNKGACYTSYSGEIKKEESQQTGAYRSAERGTLIVTDVDIAKYPPVLDIFVPGVYHLYDYQFFYRNLQENVAVRTKAFTG